MKNPWKLFGVFLLTAAALGAEPRVAPGPYAVNVKNQADGKPLGAVYVQLGGRQAVSDAAGTATLDGVPAGKYALVIVHPDFDRVEREVTLAAGVRAPLDLGLVPRVTTPVSGTVKAEGQGGAVAGARIRLVVKEAKAAVKGDYTLATDWEGKFSVIEVPVGLYRAFISAPGFADQELDWPIQPKEPPRAITLVRVSTPGALTVTVNQAGTQKPLANALVTLAEAWPAGRIAEGRTDAGGRMVFGQLRLGQVNWANAKGEVDICGSRPTVRVEADGHASAVVPVELESGHSLTQRGTSQGSDNLIRVGNQRVKEGMRQMSKEYNRQVAQFLQAKGVDAARALPPRLKQGLDIFKQVEKGMPVEQAREMLKALTPKGGVPVTPESIAEDLGHFVEFMNRWGLRAAA